mmetsp:Transcript_126640/g.405461  ORF Transcript_126640/g.405461 Transcript_126640/m.405461 type:complete len:243 (+) Transcript_126640:61-789(+)
MDFGSALANLGLQPVTAHGPGSWPANNLNGVGFAPSATPGYRSANSGENPWPTVSADVAGHDHSNYTGSTSMEPEERNAFHKFAQDIREKGSVTAMVEAVKENPLLLVPGGSVLMVAQALWSRMGDGDERPQQRLPPQQALSSGGAVFDFASALGEEAPAPNAAAAPLGAAAVGGRPAAAGAAFFYPGVGASAPGCVVGSPPTHFPTASSHLFLDAPGASQPVVTAPAPAPVETVDFFGFTD